MDSTKIMPVLKSFLLILATVFIGLLTFVVIRTIFISRRVTDFPSRTMDDSDYIELTDKKLERFKAAIDFQTISYDHNDANYTELTRYIQFIASEYPLIHSSPLITRTVISNYSLLYSVAGSDPSLTPYLFSAHLDVVPAEATKWHTEPFQSKLIDGYIYGRGTIDFKNGVHGILEALEYSLSKKFVPRRSFFVALGHDEELGGHQGAKVISEYLRTELGVTQLEFVLDEGPPILKDIVTGITEPFALLGVTEKGSALLELTVTMETGHSSMPKSESSIGVLAAAIHKLETTSFPSMLKVGTIEHEFFEAIAPLATWPRRLVLSNVWLFSSLLSYVLSFNPSTRASVRTITAVTIFKAGVKDNVLPQTAMARVHHRIHSSQTVQEVINYDRKIIADDRVKIRLLSSKESHPVAPHSDDSFGYQTIKATIQQIMPGILVAPGVMVANTDSGSYLPFTTSLYTFAMRVSRQKDIERLHGVNERISVKDYERGINFYYHIMKNSDHVNLAAQRRENHSEL